MPVNNPNAIYQREYRRKKRNQRKHLYIYALVDPRTNEPRYVGKTTDMHLRRLLHISSARTFHDGSHEKNEWIRTLLELGLQPEVRLLETLPIDTKHRTEREWMIKCHVAGYDLLNRKGMKSIRRKYGTNPPK